MCVFLPVEICLKLTEDFCESSGSRLYHLPHVAVPAGFLAPLPKVLVKIEGGQSSFPRL